MKRATALLIVLIHALHSLAESGNPCTEKYNVRDPDGCQSFYQCPMGSRVTCPEGMLFDQDDEKCSKREWVKCVVCPDPNALCPERDNPCLKYVRDAEDCQSFYVCPTGSRVTCPQTMLFDQNRGNCYFADEVYCVDREAACPKSVGRFPYPGDCSRYMICDGSIPHFRKCPDDFCYSPKKRRCDYNKKIDCGVKTGLVNSKTDRRKSRVHKFV